MKNVSVRQICIEFNHSQLDYYTELDAVSLGGILNYPEDGVIRLTRPPMTSTLSGYIFDDNQQPLSDISMSSVAPKVIYFQYVFIQYTCL